MPDNAPAAVLEQPPAVPDNAPAAVSDSGNQVEGPANVKKEEEDSDSDIEVVYIKPASKKARRSWTKVKEEQLNHTAPSLPLAASSSQTARGLFCSQGHGLELRDPCDLCDFDLCRACARKA